MNLKLQTSHQKRAMGKVLPHPDHDFEPCSRYNERKSEERIPRRSGNCNSIYTSLNSVTNAYTVNNLNQYKEITNLVDLSGYRLLHDSDGNTTRISEHSLYYDAENRLASYMFGLDANEVGTFRNAYTYDHLGRRLRTMVQEYKVYAPGGITPPTYWWHTNEVTTFMYDGWNLIHERVAHTNGTADEIEYAWGLDLSGTLQAAGGVGGLLFEKRNGAIYIPCYDANGNITTYVDTNGTVRAYRQFDAFGNTIAKGGDMVDVFHFWFSTKYFDHDTGLFYYGYRYYSPTLQRWINCDPIEESGGVNLYGFVKNDSVNGIDMLGMWQIIREGNAFAIARVTSDSDTFDSLARSIGLDTSDYKQWAHTEDKRPCGEYKIPNTVYYHHGELKGFWENWPNNIIGTWHRQDSRRAASDRGNKFKVEIVDNVSDSTIKAALSDEYLYQYSFAGHGTGLGQINVVNNSGVEPFRFTKHGINLLVMHACNSAARDGKAGLKGFHKYNRWEWNVATRGFFIGEAGAVNLFTEMFDWRITKGINKK